MKALLRNCISAIVLIAFIQAPPSFAGFSIPKVADGEDLGRPARPNPTPGAKPRILPADPVAGGAKDKLKAIDRAKRLEILKKSVGTDEWGLLDQAQKDQRFVQRLQREYDLVNDPGSWDGLGSERQGQKINQLQNDPSFRRWIDCLIIIELGCNAFDALDADEQNDLLSETAVIAEIGQDAWDALDGETQDELRAAADLDLRAIAKVEAARCNVANAIEFIKCIPVPDPNPLGVPSGAAVADCLQKTWEKRRLCIDFVSDGAFGMIKPNCKGKEKGCDPDNNPINVSVNFIPCDKRDKIYDPDLYLLITTLYHEGIHALQAFDAKPVWPGVDSSPEERKAYTNALRARELKSVCNELETHGAENVLIDALCGEVLKVAGGNPADPGDHVYLKKVLDCFAAIEDADERKAAAADFKKALRFNKRANDNALFGYNARKPVLKALVDNPELNRNRVKKFVRKTVIFEGNPVTAGGESGMVEQVDYDPLDGSEIQMGFPTPMDEIYDLELARGDTTLLVFGADLVNTEGVLFAYTDADGDGFFDPETERALVRDLDLLAPVDIVGDPTNGQFLMVNLFSGEIYALFEGEGFETFDLLPESYFLVGNLDLQPELDFVQRVVVSPDGNTIIGLPGIVPSPVAPPMLLPGFPIISSTFLDGEFQPDPVVQAFDVFQFPPVFIEADGLPVIDTTSVINDLTTQLLIGGVPGSEVRLQILPPNPPIEPIPLDPEGQYVFDVPLPLQPGMEIVLMVPDLSDPIAPPLFEIHYIVRDSTPQLILPQFDPGIGFTAQLIGIPGMPHQILHSPDMVIPFEPLELPPIVATELPLQLPPILMEPMLERGFFRPQPILPEPF